MKQKSSAALPPPTESRRLLVLQSYDILDTPREAAFDDITRLASTTCGTPMASITLIDADRQWFKSEIGLGKSEAPIQESICAHVIHEHDVMIVPDISVDPRFSDNPFFAGAPDLKFYAGAPIATTDGIVLGTVCVLDTVTRSLLPEQVDALRALARQVMMQLELRKMLKTSERISKYRAQMLESASNVLRQPLFVASLSVQSLLPEAAPHQAKRLRMADEGMETIKKGLNRMLVAASSKATFDLVEFVDIELGGVLEFVHANFSQVAKDRRIRFDFIGTSLRVKSDLIQLQTLIGNLVSNAVKYTGAGGRVVVGCRRHADHVVIHVIDTGVGMADDASEMLFEAFRQGGLGAAGLGLDLWIVKQAAQALGVTVQVHSAPGKGTHFRLHVPFSPSPDRSDEPAIQLI